jgi:adenylate kinase
MILRRWLLLLSMCTAQFVFARQPIIVFLGPPASGKGTQSRMCAHKLGLPLIGIGDLFRRTGLEDSEVGHLCRDLKAAHTAIPLDLKSCLIHREIEHVPDGGFVLDSWPKEFTDASRFFSGLDQEVLIILFDVKDETLMQRIANRRICSNIPCSDVYGGAKEPLHFGYCNLCGSPLRRRESDSLDHFRWRLEKFRTHYLPNIERFSEIPKVSMVRIDADREKSEITKDVNAAIASYFTLNTFSMP